MRAAVKYGRAIQHAASMFKRLSEMKDAFDFEVSVDETDAPTTPLEHFFIANELDSAGREVYIAWRRASSVASKKAWITSAMWTRWMSRWQNMPR